MKNYKILILGNTGDNVNNAYSWFVRTITDGFFHLGHKIWGYDYKNHSIDQIKNHIFSYKPDIIFTHLTMHHFKDKFEMMQLFDDIRRLLDTKIIHTMQDARHEPRYIGDISYAFDLAFVAQTENLKKFEKIWKVPVYYWPYSSLTYNKMANPVNNLKFKIPVFTGSPNTHQDRSDFIRRLQSKMKIKIIKTQSTQDLRSQTPQLSVSTECILGLCTGYDISGFCEVRPWQYLGTGACMIQRKFKDMDKIIPEDLYYSINDYSDQSANQVKELFQKIKKTDTWPMRKKAFNFIQKKHSSKIRMQQTLEIIENKRNSLDVFL